MIKNSISFTIAILEFLMFMLGLFMFFNSIALLVSFYVIALALAIHNNIPLYDLSKGINDAMKNYYSFPIILFLFYFIEHNPLDLSLAFIFGGIATIKIIAIWIQENVNEEQLKNLSSNVINIYWN